MKVFKFGGGILDSPEAIKKVAGIINRFPGEALIIVVSAFGKTTNALEQLILSSYRGEGDQKELLGHIRDYHLDITRALFSDPDHPVHHEIDEFFNELNDILFAEKRMDYACFYDQVICYGELISSKIVSHTLTGGGMKNTWADVRKIVVTDSNFRDASVEWEISRTNAEREIRPLLVRTEMSRPLIVTQGFIGSDQQGLSTSLGREGSDYTASIFANLLGAGEVITWKDVPGILNADPKHFKDTVKLSHISYAEATELAYYGAKVIHPKTVWPLQNKGIPLQVRSFTDPDKPGTMIHDGAETETKIPCYIYKSNQVLISVSTRDFSFIDEKVFNAVFALLARYTIHMNIIQNAALTLSFCTDDHPYLKEFISALQLNYTVRYNKGLELITIRHYNEKAKEFVLQNKQVLLEQQNRTVVQYVVR